MKYLFISMLLCLNCKSQTVMNASTKKDTITSKSSIMYYIPDINPDFEKFNFQKNKEKYSVVDLVYLKNNREYKGKSYKLEEKVDNKIISRYYGLLENGDIVNPYENIYYTNAPFFIKKIFYPNGNIKEKGLYIVSGNLYKGVWYYFNENGQPIQAVDNDKIYGFKWEDVEKFMLLNKIPIPLGNAYHGLNAINRFTPLLYPQSSNKEPNLKSDKNLWSITWRGESFNQYYDIILDGDTGKMLYRKKYWIMDEPGDKVPEPVIEDFTK